MDMTRVGFLLILMGSAVTACPKCQFPSAYDLPEQRQVVETYYDLPHAANNISAMRLWSAPRVQFGKKDDFWPFLLQLHGDKSGELFTSKAKTLRILKEIFPKPADLHFQFQVFDDSTIQVFLNSETVEGIWKNEEKDEYLTWCSKRSPEVKHLIRLPLATRIDPLALSNPGGAIQAYCRNKDTCESAKQQILDMKVLTISPLNRNQFVWPHMVLPCEDCEKEPVLKEPAWCGSKDIKSRIGECVEIKVEGKRPLEFTSGSNRLLIKFAAIDGERETLQLLLACMSQLTYISTTLRKTPLLASATRSVQGGGRHDVCNMLRDHDINGEGYTIGLVDMGIDMHSSFFIDPNNLTPCSIDDDKYRKFGRCNNVLTDDKVYADANEVTVNGIKYHHQPLGRKVTSIVVDKGAREDLGSSHGTSTAAAINGFMSTDIRYKDCPMSKTKHRGIAYSAKIALYDVGTYGKNGWGISTPDHDYAKMFAVAHALNASEFVVPFGSDSGGRYTPIADDIDRFMAENPEALVVVAAGNGGSISSPAVSKNALAVGAVNQAFTGPAGFSSKGPTQAGLVKPDILAPGSNVMSPIDDYDSTQAHCKMERVSGTSISAALIGGAATLVREYFERGFYPSGEPSKSDSRDVSAATIKAVLVNSARQRPLVSQGGYTCKTTDKTGHGAVHLENSLPFSDNHDYEMHMFEQIAYGATCEHGKCYNGKPGGDYNVGPTAAEDIVLEFDIEVQNPDVPVSATLAWIDPPAVRGARNKIVQDISIEIASPGGGIWKQQSFKQCNGVDHAFAPVENTQKVTVLSTQAQSVYTVRVRKKFVFGNQKFSVVATGGSIKKKDAKAMICCPEGSVATWAGCFSVDYGILTVLCVIIGVVAIVALVLLYLNAKKKKEDLEKSEDDA